MADYAINKGTTDWDVPLNADLTDINSRLTTSEANIASITTTANNAVPKGVLVVNVRDHGAVGDGITDDTAAIQNAINQGGVTFFPAGTYIITSITPKAGTVLSGVGRNGYIPSSASQLATLKLKSGANVSMIIGLDQVENVMIRYLNFDGNQANNTSGDIIHLNDAGVQDTAWHIYDCFLDVSPHDGIYIGTGRQAVKMSRSWIMRSANNGVTVNGADCGFETMLIGLSGSNGVYLGAWVQHLVGCDIWSSGSNGILCDNVHMVSITNCGIDRHGQSAVVVQTGGSVAISNCMFHSNSQSANNTYPHIQVSSGQVAITANTFATDGLANNPNYAINATGGTIREWANNQISGAFVTGYINNAALVNNFVTGSLSLDPARQVNVGGSGSGATFVANRTNATDGLTSGRITGDTVNRFSATVGGSLAWGPGGSTAQDVTLARTGTAQLQLTAGTLDMNAKKITGLANGTASTDAAAFGQIVAKGSQVVNVQDFGASGAGTGDQAAAINSAITSLTAGGVVYFPPGNYQINSSTVISLPANVVLRGAGAEASAIVIGSSFTGAQAVNVTGDGAQLQELQIRGAASTTSTNPTAFAVASVNNQRFRITNCRFKWINNYAVKAWGDTTDTSTDGTTLHGGLIADTTIENCAGGVWLRTTNGGSISGVWPANFMMSNVFTRFLGLNSGTNANLDGIRVEDCGDVLMMNVLPWMNGGTGGTGAALRVVGNCAAIFIQNLDALGPTTGVANVQIESNGNGDPQNVQIQGGVIQQGAIGLTIAGAANQIRVRGVRILNNQTHGVQVSSTGFGIYLDECPFSLNGAGATGTNYEVNWTGSAEGFITDCRFGTNIVSTGSAGVQGVVNITSAVVRVDNVNFTGSGTSGTNIFPGIFPQYLLRADLTNAEWRGNLDMRLTGSNRLSIRTDTASSNGIAFNVAGTAANDNARILGDGTIQLGPGSAARDTTWGRQGVAQIGTVDSDIIVGLAGKGLRVKEGTNAKQGTSTLTAGSVVVSNTSVTATSRIFVTSNADGGTPGWLRVSARTAGTSFTITSSSGTDTSTVAWQIFEPA